MYKWLKTALKLVFFDQKKYFARNRRFYVHLLPETGRGVVVGVLISSSILQVQGVCGV